MVRSPGTQSDRKVVGGDAGNSNTGSWRRICSSIRCKSGPGSTPSSSPSRRSSLLVGTQCLCLSPRPIQAEHQLCPATLPEGLGVNPFPETGQDVVMVAGGKLRIRCILLGGSPCLVQPGHLTGHEPLVRPVSERASSPQGQRLVEACRRLNHPALSLCCSRSSDQTLEPAGVVVTGVEHQRIATGAGLQDAPFLSIPASGLQHLAQPRDVHLERCHSGVRWVVAPESLDQQLGTDDLAWGDHQRRGETAPHSPDRFISARSSNLDRAQDS